ncbi:hypothetical protein SAMN04515666_108209 [Bosea lupini]|uniref:Uncharacterized protein n=1 Tax=Bosea lupini TaxID=1036779 RepID=A0A1H7WJU7_9HYPH|nr:hypothetical protein SAMN04515666_108209 [Bosea lupini]
MATEPTIGRIWRARTRRTDEPVDLHSLPRNDKSLIAKPDRMELCRVLVGRQGLRCAAA